MKSDSNRKPFILRLGPFMGLIFIFIGGALLNGGTFLNLYNQINVLGRVSIIALPAIGMTLVILSAGIDLSVGSMVSLSTVVCAMLLMERTWTKATSLSVPIFTLFAFLIGYFIVQRLVYRLRSDLKLSRLVGLLFGIIIASITFFLCFN